MKRRTLLLVAGAASLAAGCATPQAGSGAAADKKKEIDGAVDTALADLYRESPAAKQFGSRAQGILVFPTVLRAGFIVGGTYGTGALRKSGRTVRYYSIGAGSVGLLAGAESKSMFLMFMTPEALAKFENSNGWTAGADASVTMIDAAASTSADTMGSGAQVLGFVRGQQGLMANLSINGTRISRLDL